MFARQKRSGLIHCVLLFMKNVPDLAVVLRFGGHERALWVGELEASLQVPQLRTRLLALIFSPKNPQIIHEREGGKGVERVPQIPGTVNGEKSSFKTVPVREWEGGVGEGRETSAKTASAAHLADALGDWSSIAFFRRVVERVPAEVIREALVAALDVPRKEVRRSRAAYFTAVLRRRLGGTP